MAKSLYDFKREQTEPAAELLEAALALNIWAERARKAGWTVSMAVTGGVLAASVSREQWTLPEEGAA